MKQLGSAVAVVLIACATVTGCASPVDEPLAGGAQRQTEAAWTCGSFDARIIAVDFRREDQPQVKVRVASRPGYASEITLTREMAYWRTGGGGPGAPLPGEEPFIEPSAKCFGPARKAPAGLPQLPAGCAFVIHNLAPTGDIVRDQATCRCTSEGCDET